MGTCPGPGRMDNSSDQGWSPVAHVPLAIVALGARGPGGLSGGQEVSELAWSSLPTLSGGQGLKAALGAGLGQ